MKLGLKSITDGSVNDVDVPNWMLLCAAGALVLLFFLFAFGAPSSQTINISTSSNHSYSSNPVNVPPIAVATGGSSGGGSSTVPVDGKCPAGQVDIPNPDKSKGGIICVIPIDPIGDIIKGTSPYGGIITLLFLGLPFLMIVSKTFRRFI